MTDEERDRTCGDESPSDLSRRDFVALSLAAGLGAARSSSRSESPVVETNVDVKTPDGVCDAAFICPATGSHPGVIVWPDSLGLRPTIRDLGRRIAAVPDRVGAGASFHGGFLVTDKPDSPHLLAPRVVRLRCGGGLTAHALP